MILEAGNPRRLGIYFFYDADGVVDDYVVHFLRAMRPDLSSLVVVCNGKLDGDGRNAFEALGATVITRENDGFDVWAYKTALDFVGWDRLVEFDEVVMMNFTIMGPVNSFADMYAEMGARDLDFWGITVHNGANFDPWDAFEDGRIPLHIQSHFIAVRGRMLRSPEFQRYWDEMVEIRTYQDAVSKHEARFTPFFESRGFVWQTYVDTRDLDDVMFYPLFNEPIELIENRRCPIVKRKSFFATPDMYLGENGNDVARALYDYLVDSGRYDPALLIPHLLRTSTQHELRSALNLFRVHPDRSSPDGTGAVRAAIVVDGTHDRALPDRLARAEWLRESLAVHVVGGEPEETAPAGSDAVLDALLRLADDYDVVGVLGAMGTDSYPGTVPVATAKHGYDAVAADPAYVASILAWFDRDAYLGMTIASPPLHSTALGSIGRSAEESGLDVAAVLDAHGVRVPFRADPDAGDVGVPSFWFRTSAIREALEAVRAFSPEQRMLLLPLFAQAGGYYTSHVLSAHQAEAALTNLHHVIRTINRTAGHLGDDVNALVWRQRPDLAPPPPAVERPQPQFTVYWDLGGGFSEENTSAGVASEGADGSLTVEWAVPRGAVGARVDPIEGSGFLADGVAVLSPARAKVTRTNGTRDGRTDVFDHGDPSYFVSGPFPAGEPLRIAMRAYGVFPSGWGVGSVLSGRGRSRR
ncbi:rhamnan synthesis F family protein [Leifsonia aquatica]|uniref:rhamnan synthesis F family protein n=1 Tax=Leifsonia aquatica TaxID=144185 RepID=UPI0038059130